MSFRSPCQVIDRIAGRGESHKVFRDKVVQKEPRGSRGAPFDFRPTSRNECRQQRRWSPGKPHCNGLAG